MLFQSDLRVAFVGHPKLVDYTSTKGAIVGFTRALSNQLVKEKGIRVNCVVRTLVSPGLATTEYQLGLPDLPFVAHPQCPGPILTPLVVATMGEESMKTFGVTTSIGRAGVSLCLFTFSL